jgi:predicted nucleic acid-binding protein
MTPVFLDTVGLLAVWDVDDQWHSAAEAAYQEMVSRKCTVLTTMFVLLECGNAASRRTYRGDVCDLRRVLEQRGGLIVPTEDDCRTAWDAYERGEAGQASIVDHVSFVVMRRLGLTEAFTNDRHFQSAGFTTLF